MRSKDISCKTAVGRVASPHGVRGEINVIPMTDYPERFSEMETAELYKNGKFFRSVGIGGIHFASGGTLTLITDLESRDEAEECVGALIMIDNDERVELPPDTFWVDDLIGMSVEDMSGNRLGIVSDFVDAGAHELYEVKDADGKLHYIPAVAEFIDEVSPDKGLIRVSLIEGLWEASCT